MTDQKEETIEAKVDANYKKYGILQGPKPTFHYYLTPPQRLIDIYYTFALTENERQIVKLAGGKIIKGKDRKRIADKVGVSEKYVRERGWHAPYSVHEREHIYDDMVSYFTHVISAFNLGVKAQNSKDLKKRLDVYLSPNEFAAWKTKLKGLREECERRKSPDWEIWRYRELLHYLDENQKGFKQAAKGDLDEQLIELAKKFKNCSLDRSYIMEEFFKRVPTIKIVNNFQGVLEQMGKYVKAKELIGKYKFQEKA
ncbi:hypothetical protein HYW20_06175 [Candidatus Woesearchaeota archaeon]|nr:hypothetical protein [Candidatus Woesearchaeota archaeon]